MSDVTIGNASGTYDITAGDDSVITVGNGNDTIDVSGGNDASIAIGNGNDTLTATGGTGNDINIGNGNDSVTVSGGSGNTVKVGNGNDSVTTSGEADDTITVGNGKDTVSAGADSTIAAGNGNDAVTAGADSGITAGNGNDAVTAGANSTIALGNGNDTVTAGPGSTVTAGNGNDIVTVGSGSGGTAPTPTLTTLVSFNGANGYFPEATLIADAAGDLFGTTYDGGADGAGTVFELMNNGGGSYTPATLWSFTGGTDGANPHAGLIADADGDLFGTTAQGGADDFGAVFEIAKTGGGYAGTPATLWSFTGTADGGQPDAGLIADAAGDLFGTTGVGGAYEYGAVFEIAKTGSGYASTPTTLWSFSNGADGGSPFAGLIADAAGDLFGTTLYGGTGDNGTVFELMNIGTPASPSYASTPLVTFNGADGASPFAGLIADAAGDLFGTTTNGGTYGDGTVFEIAKTGSGYASTPTTLWSFTGGADGAYPDAGLIADAAGDLFGTAAGGGDNNNGTVFEIAKTGSGYASTPTTLWSFTGGADGANPSAGLTADAAGDLFGTTGLGGVNGDGVAFELTGTGYQTTSITTSKISLGNGNDTVNAGANSTITAGNGNDTVYAGANDTISLGNGNDTVYAGANDLITFGTGNDTVAFGVSPNPATIGNETVNGFNPAHDVIQFHNIGLLVNYMAVMGATSQMGSNTVITVDATDSVTLANVNASALSSHNFHFS